MRACSATARSWDFFNPTEGERATCPDVSALDEQEGSRADFPAHEW
ncbi:hypothetical protein [Myxococcus xanthus]|nr:hypothetical protein [Myxococcus xanthus]